MSSFATIYNLKCKNRDVFPYYIGSTFGLSHRKREHSRWSKKSNSKLYKFIRENGGIDNFEYDILEIFVD